MDKHKRKRSPNKGQYEFHSERIELRGGKSFTTVLQLLSQTGKTTGLTDTSIIHLAVQEMAFRMLDEKHWPVIEKIIHVKDVLPLKTEEE